MAKLIYIDTNIYLDYLENRIDKMRPLGEFAYNVFKRSLECEFSVVISDAVVEELSKFLKDSEQAFITEKLAHHKKLISIRAFEFDIKEAHFLSKERKTPYLDTLHAVLAKRSGAEIIVTRNLKDFENLSDIIESVLPENI